MPTFYDLDSRYMALSARLAAQQKKGEELQRQMAARMGPLSLPAGTPGSDIEAARGTVHRKGASVSLDYLSFSHPAEGLPAVAEWLGRQGCSDLHYEFQPPRDEPEDDPHDGE